ncbi:TPA: hypothetical protein ACIGS3_004024 [Escherichia coli]
MNKVLLIRAVKILQKTSYALMVGAVSCTEEDVRKEMLSAAGSMNFTPGVQSIINFLAHGSFDRELIINELQAAKSLIVLHAHRLNISGLNVPTEKKINKLIFQINCEPETNNALINNKDW